MAIYQIIDIPDRKMGGSDRPRRGCVENSPTKRALRSDGQSDNKTQNSPRLNRLKRRTDSFEQTPVLTKKTKGNEPTLKEQSGNIKATKQNEEVLNNKLALSSRKSPRVRTFQDKTKLNDETGGLERKLRSGTNDDIITVEHTKTKAQSASTSSKNGSTTKEKYVSNGGHDSESELEPGEVSEIDEIDADLTSSSENDVSDVDNETDDGVESTDDDEEEIHQSSQNRTIIRLHEKLSLVQQQLQFAKSELAKSHKTHEYELKKKDEEIQRIRNELSWKDEQLDTMNDLSTKNMELEAKLNEILGDKEAYDTEVERIKSEKEQGMINDQPNKDVKIEDVEKKTLNKDKAKDDNPTKKSRTKRKRKSRRGKKSEDSEGEDIDALFVSDDENDAETITEKKETVDLTENGESQSIEDKPSQPEVKKLDTPKQQENKVLLSADEEDSQDVDGEKKDKHGRHTIRKVMTGKKLQEETVQAAKTEKERRERAKKDHDKHQVVTSVDPKTKFPICTKLVLAFKEQDEKNKDKPKQPLVEVNNRLIKKLKPHQWEAVEFLWENVIESMDKVAEKDPGQGCILAHCMGLGKTLSLITLVHTLLSSEATEQFTTCLVVCPLNVIINWKDEWNKWLDKKDRLPVFEMASCKNTHDRADLLNEWHETGGIMIMGYQLFRILANYSGKSKKNKAIFEEKLLNPGPDIVICDEGHVLKNDNSAISKAMNRMKTRRRIVLTGTPLQNNLVEYHCMLSFVKPNLLGTVREFKNRFVNPITNGQHSDSTAMDVKIMKRRAHILHAMLEGCVQRKDYSVLTKLLPPKHEYVISVRLSELQVKLYEKYLELNRTSDGVMVTGGGAGLFSDYQALMRIWTHPWVLRLDEIRQEKKALEYQDDELDELDEEEEKLCSTSSDEAEEDETSDVTDDEEVAQSGEDENGDFAPSKKAGFKAQNNSSGERKTRRKKALEKASENGEDSETSSRTSRSKAKEDSKDQKNKPALSGRPKSPRKSANSTPNESAVSSETDDTNPGDGNTRKAKVLAGEVIRQWKSSYRHGTNELLTHEDIHKREESWWAKYVNEEEHAKKMELSGKLLLLFEIVRLAETLGDKVLVFSQSLLTLDLIEAFLSYKDEEAEAIKPKKGQKVSFWKKGEDYLRMDGSTGAQHRSKFTADFNDQKESRLRLFLISTKAGGLGINLDSANRVVIFDASWNPSHDVQSIFRVYRFGQVKPVYVYRLLAQGTMEEKIYERQVTKETLSQRVIDEHQIDRHFTMNDLAELYRFKPDKLNDPDAPKRPVPPVPKDVVLAELMTSARDWIVTYHEHDSLLENRPDEHLSEEERERAWEEYEREKQGLYTVNFNYPPQLPAQQQLQAGTQQLNQPPKLVTHPFVFNRQTKSYTSAFPMQSENKPTLQTVPVPANRLSNPSQQLPRVVQEILKYNPNITTHELQKRLHAFLGMQSQSGQMGRPSTAPQPATTMHHSASSPALLPQINIPGMDQAVPMPSRLPQPGNVPANKP